MCLPVFLGLKLSYLELECRVVFCKIYTTDSETEDDFDFPVVELGDHLTTQETQKAVRSMENQTSSGEKQLNVILFHHG